MGRYTRCSLGINKIHLSIPPYKLHLENLENLEKSGNSKVVSPGKVRENGKSQGKVGGSEIRCFFQALNTSAPDPVRGTYDAPQTL